MRGPPEVGNTAANRPERLCALPTAPTGSRSFAPAAKEDDTVAGGERRVVGEAPDVGQARRDDVDLGDAVRQPDTHLAVRVELLGYRREFVHERPAEGAAVEVARVRADQDEVADGERRRRGEVLDVVGFDVHPVRLVVELDHDLAVGVEQAEDLTPAGADYCVRGRSCGGSVLVLVEDAAESVPAEDGELFESAWFGERLGCRP